jgi:hypothetical protein
MASEQERSLPNERRETTEEGLQEQESPPSQHLLERIDRFEKQLYLLVLQVHGIEKMFTSVQELLQQVTTEK